MTSEKSLKNNVNFNDFKRVSKTYFLIPMVVLILLVDTTVYPFFELVSKERTANYALYFGDLDAPLVPLMLIVSFVLAVSMFFFLTKKNQVNVQLSLGITRTRLYLNRVFAGLLMIFLTVFIPLTITLIGNLIVYKEPWLALRIYCNLLFPFLSSGLVGFALGVFVSTISGNIIETIMTSLSLAFAPVLIENICYYFRMFLLNGYVSWAGYDHEAISMLFNPFCFTGNSFDNSETAFLTNVVSDSYGLQLLDTYNLIDSVLRWSLFIWSAVAVVLLFVGVFLINRRKAENSNSIGKFPVSTAINSLMVTLIVSSVMVPELIYVYSQLGTDFDVFFGNELLIFTVFAAVSILVFLVVQLVFKRRKIKSALRTMPVVIGYIVAISLLFVFHTTEYFGTYNKLPDAKEIEKIHVNVNMSDYVIINNIARIQGDNFPVPESSSLYDRAYFAETEEEIKDVYKLFEIASKSSREDMPVLDANFIGFTMTTKDGETIERDFVVSGESIEKYNKIFFNSKYFDSMIDYMVSKADETKIAKWSFFDKSGIQDADKQITIQDEKLYTAILLDYKDMDYEDFYKNTSRPLYFLSYGTQNVTSAYEVAISNNATPPTNDSEEISLPQIPSLRINVYPEMKRTIKYLEENGYADMVTYTGKIKEVLYTSGPLNCFDSENLYSEAVGENVYFSGFGMIFNIDELYDWGNLENAYVESKQDKKPDTYYNAIHLVHNTINQPLTQVTDKNLTEKIVNSSVPLFATSNDNGRYIYVVYEDDTLMMYYLPEANVGVLN